MELKTIRQFAEEQQVSYESIRRQLKVYRKDLESHIIKKGRTQFLDETAVEFLRTKRRENPVIVVKQDYREEIQDLKSQIDTMRDTIISLQDSLIELQKDNLELIGYREQNKLLLEDKKQLQEEREKNGVLVGQVSEIQKQLQDAMEENSRFKKTWFGLYRKA